MAGSMIQYEVRTNLTHEGLGCERNCAGSHWRKGGTCRLSDWEI